MARSQNTHSLGGRFTDAFRLPLALLVWNFRKTVYRWRGPKNRPPCQSPSDSGRAWETQCDAALEWDDPHRFRMVCPALRLTPHGCRCALNAADVRPFWGRAIAIGAGGLLALYLLVATLAFGAIRLGGNQEASWVDVAWPRRWETFSKTRARQFFAQAITAFNAGDYAKARLCLRTAVASDGDNYEAALMLAMWESQHHQSRDADRMFQWLVERHPAQTAQTAVVFHDILLAAGNPDKLTAFATFMTERDPARTDFWVRALLHGMRLAGNAEKFSAAHATPLARLPPPARALIATEILIQQGRLPQVREAFQRPAPRDASPVYGLIAIEQLLRLGDVPTATVWKNDLAATLGPSLSRGLDYRIEMLARNERFARACFASLLDRPVGTREADALIALLVHAPDRAASELLDQKLRTQAQAPEISAGMFLAALVCANRPAADAWASILASQHHLSVPTSRTVRFDTLVPTEADSLTSWLNVLPLPRETIYALLDRVPTDRKAVPLQESKAFRSPHPAAN